MTFSKGLTIALLFALVQIHGQGILSFRLIAEGYTSTESKTTLSLQVSTDNDQLILADQYYRFYYDASNMQLDDLTIESELSSKLYYDIQVIEHITGFDASSIDQLSYDKNLGFINMYIELKDLLKGGMSIKSIDGWITIAKIECNILNTSRPIQASWAREHLTNDYASAYTIVSDWVAPQNINSSSSHLYTDLYAVAGQDYIDNAIDLKIGPNPTSDFIKIRNRESFSNNTIMSLRDINGSLLQSIELSGSNEAIMHLKNYDSGAYFIEIANATEDKIITEKIIITKA